MKRELHGSVVVITGASAGIGRATALRLADEGAKLVLAARREDALEELAVECEQRGSVALAVATDVADEPQVQTLAQKAVDRFGRIDVWVNNAAVSAFGRFEETPPDVFRRVMETNFFGYVHGARAALRQFREQGHGTLINVSSVVGVLGQPYTSAYVSSKWAVRGLSETLRNELKLDDAKDLQVCTVLPAAIDTPLFRVAANFTGRVAKPLDPVYEADRVAKTIVSLARKPRREVYVGPAGRLAALQHTLTPSLVETVFSRQVDRGHFEDRVQAPTRGNLYEPLQGWATVSGGFIHRPQPKHHENGRSRSALIAPALVALGGAGAMSWFGLRRRQRRERRASTVLQRAGEVLSTGR